MKSAQELLNELNSIDEATQIEAKTSSAIGKSIMETVTAFANEPRLGGGYLLLGVEQVGTLFEPQYEASGLANPDKIQSDLASQCSTMLNRPIRPQMTTEQIGEASVVVVFVPEAAPTEKPVYITSKGLPRGAFRRVGPTDHECSEDDLIALYSDHQSETYDATPIQDGSMDDIDPNAIKNYRVLREKVNPDAEELGWSDDDLLRALGCTTEVKGQIKPTVAGILLFGTAMALRRCMPAMRIDYIRVPGREWVSNPDHRFDTVEIRQPLPNAIRRATNAILDDLPKSFSLPSDDIQSTESPILPNRVIREAVVNAVMHRSYRIQGSIQIIRYANRLEIRNPGHSLKAEEQLGEPGSQTRNPKIAAVLHEINIAETKGSGIRVMRELMQKNNLLSPTFDSSRRNDQFIATFLFHHFLNPEDVAWLSDLTTEKLSDEESRALIFVRELGAINNAAYRDINHTDTLEASTHLRRLRDLGLLEKKGSGNKTYYVPGLEFSTSPPAIPPQSHKPEGQSHKAGPESRKLGDQSHQAEAPPITRDALPVDLQNQLPEPGQRPNKETLRQLIIDLCAHQPMSSRELAGLLGRKNHGPLSRDHLTPLIEEGRLAYTIPKMPQHPKQKYTVPA